MLLNNKIIFVIGASGGIGSVITLRLAQEGAIMVLVGRNEKMLKDLSDKCGNHSTYFICDFQKITSMIDLCEKAFNMFPTIDGIINVAGVGIYSSIENSTLDDLESMFKVNVTAPYLFIRNLLQGLRKSPHSFVMNIGSGAGTIPMKNRSIYCASKFALRGFTLSLAEEFDGRSPKFCLITLGSTLTNFGGKSIEEKKKEFAKGQAYFPVEWVANRLTEVIKDENRATEITLFPGDHGFGVWKKP